MCPAGRLPHDVDGELVNHLARISDPNFGNDISAGIDGKMRGRQRRYGSHAEQCQATGQPDRAANGYHRGQPRLPDRTSDRGRSAVRSTLPLPDTPFYRENVRTAWPLQRQHIPRLALACVLVVIGAIAVVLVTPAGQAAAGVSPGVTQRASVTDNGTQATFQTESGVSNVAISGNGRYEAFDDQQPLDPLANGQLSNIYVRDLKAPGHTALISIGVPVQIIESPAARKSDATAIAPRASLNTAANGFSDEPSISGNGRYVVFETAATNIPSPGFPGGDDSGVENVYICDRDPNNTGKLDNKLPDGTPDYQFTLLNQIQFEQQLPAASPTISDDGTTVTFEQSPTETSDIDISQVVVAHLQLAGNGDVEPDAITYQTVVSSDTTDPNDNTFQGRISADGSHAVFLANCEACANVGDGPGELVDVEDLATQKSTEVDVGTDGKQINAFPQTPTLSGNGSEVAWQENFFGDIGSQVLVAQTDDPAGTQITASQTTAGTQGDGAIPALSADGRYIAFETAAPGMSNGVDIPGGYQTESDLGPDVTQIVVRDLVVDASRAVAKQPRLPAELASPSINPPTSNQICEGQQPPADSTCGADNNSSNPALDDNGGVVAFQSFADDLVPRDTNNVGDAFVRLFQPTVTASPVDFGTVPDGTSSNMTLTVHQTGFGPVTLTGTQIGGPNGTDFTIFPTQTCLNAEMHEFDTCLISLKFAPLTQGPLSGLLTLTPNDGAIPVTVALTGVGGPPNVIPKGTFQVNPNPLNFPGPQLALHNSAPQTITVTDNGDGPLTIQTVTPLTGPNLFPGDYTIVTDTCLNVTLQHGDTCVLTITNTPHGSGSRPGGLEFTDTAGNSPQLVGLNASGTTPTVTVSPGVVVAGRVTNVTGTGWPANTHITLTIPQLQGADTLTVATKADGTFTTPLVVFEHAQVGPWQVVGTATGTTLQANSPLLVVLGTYQPPGFTSREGD